MKNQIKFNRPLVSVIVPSMNASRFIEAAMQSAVSQTYENLEIIVIDDGSTDDTIAVVKSVMARDSRIRLIEQANAGVAAARNAGIAVARGTYLAPLDADDVWSPRKIELQVEKMEEPTSHPLGMVYCWWYSVSEDGHRTGGVNQFDYHGKVFLRLLYQNFVGNASVPLFKTKVVKKVGGYDEKPREVGSQGCEDWDLALKVAREAPTGVVCDFLSGYRDVKGSMSSSYQMMARSHELLIRNWRHSIPDLPPKLTAWSTSHFCMWIAGKAYGTGHYWSACRYILRATVNDPAVFWLPWAGWILVAGCIRSVLSPVHRMLGISNAHIHEFKEMITSAENQGKKSVLTRRISRWVSALNRRFCSRVSHRMRKLSDCVH